MKITIDLNDPGIQKQIENAITGKLNEIIAETLNSRIEQILQTKMERVNDTWINNAVNAKVEQHVSKMFQSSYYQPSEFQKVLAAVTEKLIKESLAKK